ncbi:MAG: glycosyltransferase [Ardenticatenales bacterium]|nr:glycosyltransferase [Ardenticatenales bacterium]
MRICLIGPTYPFRGGIAHYTTLLSRHIQTETAHEALLISFSRQYPRFLYKGESDQDPSATPLTTPAEYLLDSLNPLSWWRTARRIARWQPDMVILQWWTPYWTPVWATISSLVRRWCPSARQICICHNVLPHESHWYDDVALNLAVGRSDGFIVHSEADGRVLSKVLPERRWATAPIPTYASLAAPAAEETLGLPEDRPVLLFCGLIREYKGLSVLLEALPKVLRERPVHLAIVGEFWGNSKPTYEAQIAELGIAAAVTLRDEYVADELLTAYVRRADVVVLPYRSATQSAVIQLAFGQGTPVITTNVGGLPEAVADGQTGLTVPPNNPGALAAAILRFFDEGMGPRFAAEIQARQAQFSWQRLLDVIVALSHEENAR